VNIDEGMSLDVIEMDTHALHAPRFTKISF